MRSLQKKVDTEAFDNVNADDKFARYKRDLTVVLLCYTDEYEEYVELITPDISEEERHSIDGKYKKIFEEYGEALVEKLELKGYIKILVGTLIPGIVIYYEDYGDFAKGDWLRIQENDFDDLVSVRMYYTKEVVLH